MTRKTSSTAMVAGGLLLTSLVILSACGEQSATPAAADATTAAATAGTEQRYRPEFTASGDLKLPKDFASWIYVGSPLTPDALNNGKAAFPEYHNVYIEPGAYKIYRQTGVFPEGTIMFKELQRTLPKQNADGSRSEASGRGFFPGALNGADVAVKDSKRFADTNGWGYFDFNHSEPKAETATLQPRANCADCHIAGAKKDMVWTQFYPRLDDIKLN